MFFAVMSRPLLVLALSLGMLSAAAATAWAAAPASTAAASAASSPAIDALPAANAPILFAQAANANTGRRGPDGLPITPEPVLRKPSGFWTSGRPATGGAYRYPLLAIGTIVCLCTAGFMIWVIRRHPAQRS
ncbi:MAG: hypothetical protein Tsb0020_36140 [Haliangiales bacterium]